MIRIRPRWSPPQESCAANSHCIREITTKYKVFYRKLNNAKSVILEQVIHSVSMVSYRKRIHNLVEKLWILSEMFCFKFIPIKSCPNPGSEMIYSGSDSKTNPEKSFGSDRLRIRIHNTDRKNSLFFIIIERSSPSSTRAPETDISGPGIKPGLTRWELASQSFIVGEIER